MKQLGKLYVAVDCSNCGRHEAGIPLGSTGLRCEECGRFSDEASEYCAEHDVDYKGLYPDDNHCPYCREEWKVQGERQHLDTRDRMVEPW